MRNMDLKRFVFLVIKKISFGMFRFCGPSHDCGYQSDFYITNLLNSCLVDVETSNQGFSFFPFFEIAKFGSFLCWSRLKFSRSFMILNDEFMLKGTLTLQMGQILKCHEWVTYRI